MACATPPWSPRHAFIKCELGDESECSSTTSLGHADLSDFHSPFSWCPAYGSEADAGVSEEDCVVLDRVGKAAAELGLALRDPIARLATDSLWDRSVRGETWALRLHKIPAGGNAASPAGPTCVVAVHGRLAGTITEGDAVINRFRVRAGQSVYLRGDEADRAVLRAEADSLLLYVESAAAERLYDTLSRNCPRHPVPCPAGKLTGRDPWKAACQELSAAVRAEHGHMTSDHVPIVHEIGSLLAAHLRSGGRLHRDVVVKTTSNRPPPTPRDPHPAAKVLMHKYILFEDDQVVLRVHLFPSDAAETYIHNHKRGAVSMCLAGKYRHAVWGVLAREGETHTATERVPHRSATDAGGRNVQLGEPQTLPGQLSRQAVYDHTPGSAWFMSDQCYHTVHSDEAVVSLYVGDKAPGGGATVRILGTCATGDAAEAAAAEGSEQCTEGERKEEILCEVERRIGGQ